MDALKKEIREALLGDLVPTEDGRLAVSFTRLAKYKNGLGDGFDKVLIYGVMCRRRWYLSTKNAKQMHELAVKGMQDMGRMMWLSSDKEKEAVYCTYLMNTPAILTYMRGKDGVIEVACYSARGFSGWIACWRTLNNFQKKVPEVLQRMSEEDEQKKQNAIKEKDTEEKRKAKQAKLDKKLEKKRLKKEKRKERLEKMVGFMPSKLMSAPELESGNDNLAVRNQENAEDEKRKNPEFGNADEAEEYVREDLPEERLMDSVQDTTAEEAYEAVREQATGASVNELDARKAEQARLQAEAEAAKLEAQAAQARLEAAQAKLAAQEAQAKLAEVEAKLQAQSTAVTKQSAEANKTGSNQNNHKKRHKRR